jgi:hypothetical protein
MSSMTASKQISRLYESLRSRYYAVWMDEATSCDVLTQSVGTICNSQWLTIVHTEYLLVGDRSVYFVCANRKR